MVYTYRVATENLFKILVIHTNLNCYAEYPPLPCRARSARSGRIPCVGCVAA